MKLFTSFALFSLFLTACSYLTKVPSNSEMEVQNNLVHDSLESLSDSLYLDEPGDNLNIENFLPLIPESKTLPPGRSTASNDFLESQTLSEEYKPDDIFTTIKNPKTLELLEKNGFYLASHFGLTNQNLSNSNLNQDSTLYSSMVKILTQDLQDIIQMESKEGLKVGPHMSDSGRIFNAQWFLSQIANYELVGITNRLDRVFFNPNTCGELRFIYRLSYQKEIPHKNKTLYSRLPMTLMVKYLVGLDPDQKAFESATTEANKMKTLQKQLQPEVWKQEQADNWQKCYRYADAWTYPKDISTQGEFVRWLLSNEGALGPSLFNRDNFKSVEINLQGFRIPSTLRANLGGHANYLLRVFKKNEAGTQLIPGYLENTPDVEKINSDPQLKNEFLSLINNFNQLKRIDNGIFLLPEKFLATRAISYSPYGISRRENRLYDQILTIKDINPIDKDGEELDINKLFSSRYFDFVHSPSALIKRLNDMTCVGCHQGRAMAGFHFLGIDREKSYNFNSLVFEGSGHFETELKRRYAFLNRLRPRPDGTRLWPPVKQELSIAPPLSFNRKGLPEYFKAGAGHYCGLSSKSPFSHWQCAEGFTCSSYEEAEGEKDLGKCLPIIRRAGDACISTSLTQASRNKDGLKNINQLTMCGNGEKLKYACRAPKGGFPGGMCALDFPNKDECDKLGDDQREICGHFAGSGFSQCILSVGNDHTWQDCIEKTASKSGRGICNENNACRNDYVCVRSYEYDRRPNEGVCTPAYFLFQVRLDAHPNP